MGTIQLLVTLSPLRLEARMASQKGLVLKFHAGSLIPADLNARNLISINIVVMDMEFA